MLRVLTYDEQSQRLGEILFVGSPQTHRDPAPCLGSGDEASASGKGCCRVRGSRHGERGETALGGAGAAVLLAVVAPSRSCGGGSREGGVQRARQRPAGVRARSPGRRTVDAPRPTGADCQDGCCRTARRRDLPRRRARPGLQRPAHKWRRATNTHGDGFTGPIGATQHQDLRPADPEIRIRLPDHAGRDQAGDRRSPARRAGPLPDARRVLGVRLCRSGRGAERHQPDRHAARIRGGRREHARDGLLGWGVQLLRAATEPRRLRRDRDGRTAAVGAWTQGGDDRDFLRRDQPAVRGRHRPAPLGGDCAAVGDRRHRHDALPRRNPQHRLRASVRASA